ncbi:MAG: AsmA family protein [Halothiobacillus sp.]
MKWIKRIVMWIVALILVLFIAAVAFVATFDPNDYKDKISSIVQEKTGRTIELGGPIHLTLFPWLGVSVQDVALGNAPGFAQKNMVTAKTVEVKAALLPLLKGQFEVGKLVLDGATIHLARNSNGVTNWADLLARPSTGAPSGAAGASSSNKVTALAIGGVEINDANLDWQDAVTGQSLALQHLNLDSGAIRLGQAVDMSLNFSYATQDPKLGKLTGDVRLSSTFDMKANGEQFSAKSLKFHASVVPDAQHNPAALPAKSELDLSVPEVSVDLPKHAVNLSAMDATVDLEKGFGLTHAVLTAKGALSADWQKGQYLSDKLSLAGKIQGLPSHTGELDFSAHGGVAADMNKGNISLPNWQIESAPLVVKTSLDVTGLGKNLSVTGPLAIMPFNPRQLAEALKYRVPSMQSDKALTQCAVKADVRVTPNQAMLDHLVFSLDGHDLNGTVGISDLKTNRMYARLKGGAFDVNPYLPPGTAAAKPSEHKPAGAQGSLTDQPKPVASADMEIPLPVDALRKLNLDAEINLDQLTYQKYQLKQLALAVLASGGQINMKQFDFMSFGGTIQTQAALDVRGAVPDWQTKLDARNIALQPALTAAMNEDRLSGTGDVRLALRTQGARLSKLKSALDGTADFSLRNGQIKGVDLGYMLRAAQARLQGETTAVPRTQATDFSAISGSAIIRNGVAHNDDLKGASPLLRVTGKGDVDLARETIDYLLNATVVNTATGQDGKALEKLKQLNVPITITGTFAQPKFGIDMQAVFKDQAKQKVEEKINTELDKRLGDKAAPLKNLLKGLGL